MFSILISTILACGPVNNDINSEKSQDEIIEVTENSPDENPNIIQADVSLYEYSGEFTTGILCNGEYIYWIQDSNGCESIPVSFLIL